MYSLTYKKIILSITLFLIAFSALTACTPQKESIEPGASQMEPTPDRPLDQEPSLEGLDSRIDPRGVLTSHLWILISYGPGKNPTIIPDNISITASFADGQMHGSAGCNQYGSSYTINNNDFTLSLTNSTMMACDDPAMSTESIFLAALETVHTFNIDPKKLVLTYNGGQLIFASEESLITQPSLEGPIWLLQSFATDEVASSLINGSVITAQFSNGQLNGDSGCNNYFADYTVVAEERTLTFGPIGATKKACADESVMAQEQQLFSELSSVIWYEINDQQLTLYTKSGSMLIFAPDPNHLPETGIDVGPTYLYIDQISVTYDEASSEHLLTVVGSLANPCVQITGTSQTVIEDEQMIFFSIEADRGPGEICAAVLVPYKQTFTIDSTDLTNGTYTIQAGDHTDSITVNK